jgi:4-carboxymuconolactone decarboxylase
LEKLALRYAEAVTRTPVEVSDELFESLQKQMTPAQLVELTSAIAWENYRARFNHAFGVESEAYSDGSACVLPASTQSSLETRHATARHG